MQLKQDKNGMTLIEIVVVLLISTIIMGITGAMILSSMGYFSEEVVSQQDQEGLDDIAGYIRKELSYATDVRIATTKPSEDAWHWLYIKDGKLYKDGSQLLDESYYQNRKLVMTIQGFEDFRLDVHLQYQSNENKLVAKTRTSLELLNLKAENNVSRDYAPFSTKMDIDDTQKIYYIIKEKTVEQKPDIDTSVTVEKELKCLNNFNNRGEFRAGVKYYIGDYIYDENGVWWVNVGSAREFVEAERPGNTANPIGWKKISSEFDALSAYEKGDIILYVNGDTKYYYQATKDHLTYTPKPTDANGWTDLGATTPDPGKAVCRALSSEQKRVTVRNKLDTVDITKIKEYETKTTYGVNALVKVTNPTNNIIEYYLKINDAVGAPNSGGNSGWVHLARDFNEKSAYDKGNQVLYLKDGIISLTFKQAMLISPFNVKGEIQLAESQGGSNYIELVK